MFWIKVWIKSNGYMRDFKTICTKDCLGGIGEIKRLIRAGKCDIIHGVSERMNFIALKCRLTVKNYR